MKPEFVKKNFLDDPFIMKILKVIKESENTLPSSYISIFQFFYRFGQDLTSSGDSDIISIFEEAPKELQDFMIDLHSCIAKKNKEFVKIFGELSSQDMKIMMDEPDTVQ